MGRTAREVREEMDISELIHWAAFLRQESNPQKDQPEEVSVEEEIGAWPVWKE
ncbi:hypothetical protein QF001_003770 [Paraburkholderia youngii]|uniref:hypothetical protein n=1 Tax=Paraburkholderia youngii TaxID=2782701 RepID=UPI003D25B04D